MTIPPQATRREWIGLTVIALPCRLYSMDLTVLFLAVPSLSEDLKPNQHAVVVDHGHLRFHGRGIAHHHGDAGRPDRPSPAAAHGAALFGGPSVLAAFSSSAEMLIATTFTTAAWISGLLALATAIMAVATLRNARVQR